MSKRVKKIIIVLFIFALLIVVLSLMGGKSPETTGPLSSTASTSSNPVLPSSSAQPTEVSNIDFASMLSTIRTISIDTSIFSNPAYRALRDHPISLGTDIIGRSNPFAPVGSDTGEATLNPTVQTLQPGKITETSTELSAQVTFATTAPVSVVFQYGTSDAFGSATSPQVLSKGGTVVATVSGLLPGTMYYVQAVAVVGSTTTNGNRMTFTTAGTAAQ